MFHFCSIRITELFVFLVLLIPQIPILSQEYNKRADYVYNFENTDAKVVDVTILKNNLGLPVFNESYQTALLEVDIRTSPGIRLRQPYIEIVSDEVNARQYFQFGSKGIRYLNLSEVVQKDLGKMQINTRHCRLKGKESRVFLYENSAIQEEQLLVLAPHPDDAEIAAYGLYSGNKNATVVNITVGDAGKKMYDELYADDTIHYIKKANLRLWNSITVPLLAGLSTENCINLGYFDATLKTMYLNPGEPVKPRYTGIDEVDYYRKQNISRFLDSLPAQATWNSLVGDLKRILEAKQPTVIVTPYPAIDVHPDHKLTTLALLQALKEMDYPNVELYLYTNHFIHSEMYPTGKKGSLISLPPATSDEAILFNRLYSHTLNEVLQADKVLALEAMNPLRPDTEWHTTGGSWKLFCKTLGENIRNTEQDYYYRRAVRNNELFFVVHSNEILEQMEKYNLVTGNLDFLKE